MVPKSAREIVHRMADFGTTTLASYRVCVETATGFPRAYPMLWVKKHIRDKNLFYG
jgi:hypothetical protein